MEKIPNSSILAVWPDLASVVMDYAITHMDIAIDDPRYMREHIMRRVHCTRDGSDIVVNVLSTDGASHAAFCLFVSASF